MIIPINDDWRISTDEWNWIVEQCVVLKTGPKKGLSVWSGESFHPSLAGAVTWLYARQIRMLDVDKVGDLLIAIEKVGREIKNALLQRERVQEIEQLNLFGLMMKEGQTA